MTTKKTTAPAKAPEPMDTSVREDLVPVVKDNNQRPCWAIKQLVKEVDDLFPLTAYEVSAYNGRNTGLDVTFDCSVEPDLIPLLELVRSDSRVANVEEEEGQVLVSMWANPRVYDSRASYDIAAAWVILEEDEEGSA